VAHPRCPRLLAVREGPPRQHAGTILKSSVSFTELVTSFPSLTSTAVIAARDEEIGVASYANSTCPASKGSVARSVLARLPHRSMASNCHPVISERCVLNIMYLCMHTLSGSKIVKERQKLLVTPFFFNFITRLALYPGCYRLGVSEGSEYFHLCTLVGGLISANRY
jgi:hypothetical protein